MINKKQIISTFILILGSLQLMSQTTIRGDVTDNSGKPLPYAIIAYNMQNDSSESKFAEADSTGKFYLTVRAMPIIVNVSYLSYATSTVVCKDNRDLHISLIPDSLSLDEVVVKGQRPKLKLTEGGIQVNVTGTALEKLGNAEDVLLHMPMIRKKGDEIDVFGKGAPTIYINGIEMRSDKELQQLKSTDIKDINLVLNPGSQYDATSTSVILINTIRKKDPGLSVDVSGAYGKGRKHKDKAEMEANVNYTFNNLNLFGSMWVNNEGALQDADIIQKANSNNSAYTESIFMNNRNRNRNGHIMAGFNYMGDSSNGGMKYYLYVPMRNSMSSMFNNDITVENTDYDQLMNLTEGRTHPKVGHRVSSYYNLNFGKSNLKMDADFMHTGYDTSNDIKEQSKANSDRHLTTTNSVRNTLFAFKMSLSVPILGGKYNIGTEDTYTKRKDIYEEELGYVPTANGRFRQTSLAFFTGYTYDFDFLSLSASIRYENVNYTYEDAAKTHKVFNNFFPSISVDASIGQVGLNLSYTSKIARPSYRQLSNDVQYASMYSLMTGNPLLENTTIDDLSLIMGWNFIQFVLDYSSRHHDIIYYSYPMSGNQYVLMTTYKNIPRVSVLAPTLVVSPQLGIWNPEITIGLMKQWLKRTEYLTGKFEKPIWNFELSNNFKTSNGWLAVIDFNCQTKGNSQNAYINKNVYDLSLNFSKSLCKDKVNIKFAVDDILNHNNDASTLYCPNVNLSESNRYFGRCATVTIRYTFNRQESKYKGTGAGSGEMNRL